MTTFPLYRVCSKENVPCFSDFADEVRSSKQRRRRAERHWRKTGLTVHKQINKSAKKTVTKLVHKAKSSYYCNRVKETLSCRELFSVTKHLLRNKKPPLILTVLPLVNLQERFLDFFFKSDIETIRNTLDVRLTDAHVSAYTSFYGERFTHFRPVTIDFVHFVKRNILSSPSKNV